MNVRIRLPKINTLSLSGDNASRRRRRYHTKDTANRSMCRSPVTVHAIRLDHSVVMLWSVAYICVQSVVRRVERQQDGAGVMRGGEMNIVDIRRSTKITVQDKHTG